MIKKSRLLIAVLLILVTIGACTAARFLIPPSIHPYQKQFGFSLDNIKTEITDHVKIEAFRDPSSAYIVKMSGDIQGSDFDPATMIKGVSASVTTIVNMVNADLKAEGKQPLFTLEQDGDYYCRQYKSNTDSSTFTVIYDHKKQLYYMIWAG